MSNRVTVTFADIRRQGEFDPQFDAFFSSDEQLEFNLRWPTSQQDHPGVLVYISPKASAAPPEGWLNVLDEQNLVWVGAHNSGNDVHVARRVGMALLGAALANRTGEIDEKNILLSGFSGGGRVASMMMPTYPERFAGALFICGANPLFTVTEEALERLQSVPMMFLTGSGDFNLEDTRMAIRSYQQAGLKLARLFEIADLEHALPDAAGFSEAMSYLQQH